MRSHVIKHVIALPMLVKTQQEPDGRWVAFLPEYRIGNWLVDADSEGDALLRMYEKAAKHWGFKLTMLTKVRSRSEIDEEERAFAEAERQIQTGGF